MTYLQNQIENLVRIAQEEEGYEPYYEVLQSITLTGDEVFITDWFPNYRTSKIQYCTEFPSLPATTAFVFGARDLASAAYPSFGTVFILDNNVMKLRLDNTRTSTSSTSLLTTVTANTDYFYEMYNRTFISNGTTSSVTGDAPNQNTLAPFCLGTTSWSSGAVTSTDSIKIGNYYYKKAGTSQVIKCLKCYDNMTNLVHDYIPVLDSKMRPCLYDKITKTFIYAYKLSDGTTAYDLTFKRWNKYDVDYIENTGTAYIPFADITPTTTMGMNIEYAYTVLSSSEPAGVIGTYNGDTQRKDTFFVSTSSGSTQKASSPSSASCGVMVFHRGGNVGTSSATSTSYIEPEKDVWYKATVNWLGDGEITWTDGTNELSANVGANSVMTNQLRLFSRCNSSNNTYNNCKSRVRKLQFSDGNNIIRSFKPVVWHNSDTTAIATLYDEVYNKMMTPTGSFKAYIIGADDTIYEVGRSVSGTPSSSVSGVSNCFDTGLYGTQDTTVKHIAIAYDSDSTSGQLFGSYDGTQTTSKNLTINSTGTSGNTAPIRFDGKVISTPIRIAINKTVSIVNSKYGLWVNDTLHGSWGSVNDFTTLTTMLILKCNNSTNTRNNGCGYCLILEKDVPIVEYIPIKNGSTIGLYDKVSKTINTGVGTINFNALD